MSPFHVVVYAAAPIPHGDEIEVQLLKNEHDPMAQAVVVFHVATSVLYGSQVAFEDRATHAVVGDGEHYRAPRPGRGWRVETQLRGRVRECVVSNLPIGAGMEGSYVAAITSFLVEPSSDATPYR